MAYCCGGRKTVPLPILPELNVASAQLLAFQAGQSQADSVLIGKRLVSCRACPYFNVSQSLCNRCGCLIVAKVGKERESCPIRRW